MGSSEEIEPPGSGSTLGDTSVDVISTPGHTMGTVSLLFDVRDRTVSPAH
jgi:glyoxylase-like metal-dependent hydrolase (beta-lactamase superfamily II)